MSYISPPAGRKIPSFSQKCCTLCNIFGKKKRKEKYHAAAGDAAFWWIKRLV